MTCNDVIVTQQTNPHAFNIRMLYHYYTNECTLQELAYFTSDFNQYFFLLVHNESLYVSIDITASDFDINRCHLNISAAYFSVICVSFARESQYS